MFGEPQIAAFGWDVLVACAYLEDHDWPVGFKSGKLGSTDQFLGAWHVLSHECDELWFCHSRGRDMETDHNVSLVVCVVKTAITVFVNYHGNLFSSIFIEYQLKWPCGVPRTTHGQTITSRRLPAQPNTD